MQELIPNVYHATTLLKLGPIKFLAAMYAIKAESEVVLINPFELDGSETEALETIGKPTHILIDGITHERDSDAYRKRYGAKILVHREAVPKLGLGVDDAFGDGDTLPAGLTAIGMPGTRPGETIFLRRQASGTLIAGDALFNLRPNERPFIMRLFGCPVNLGVMPKFAIKDKVVARQSYQRLLEYDFDQILVSHGHPILSGAKAMLSTVLGNSE